MYVASTWVPPRKHATLTTRATTFKKAIEQYYPLNRVASTPNLTLSQRQALEHLRKSGDILVVQCDKNLGPAVIKRDHYISFVFRDHLSDEATYRFIDPTEHDRVRTELRQKIGTFRFMYSASLSKDDRKYFERVYKAKTHDSLPVFYVTMKVHKTPLKTRPIVSCSGSLLLPIGLWLDKQLQKIAAVQKSYFKSSFELKDELVDLALPAGCRLHTSDAVSMYTNIPTAEAIAKIETYLNTNRERFRDIPIKATIAALRLVMQNNYFTFGDTMWLQLEGTAMGTPPAPS